MQMNKVLAINGGREHQEGPQKWRHLQPHHGRYHVVNLMVNNACTLSCYLLIPARSGFPERLLMIPSLEMKTPRPKRHVNLPSI